MTLVLGQYVGVKKHIFGDYMKAYTHIRGGRNAYIYFSWQKNCFAGIIFHCNITAV